MSLHARHFPANLPDLEPRLRALVARARGSEHPAGLPELPGQAALTDDDFLAHVATVAPSGADLGHYLDTLNAPDLLLAAACARKVPAALARFEQRYLANLGALTAGITLSPTQLEELGQSLREKLLVGSPTQPPRIARYSGRGALLSWVRIAASRAALDLLSARAERGHQAIDDVPAERLAAEAHPESHVMQARYREPFEQALRDAFASLSSEQRNHLRLSYAEGLSIDELGALFHVHRATAARWVASARSAVFERTRALLQERLGLASGELDSVVRAAQAGLDLSLSAILPSTEEGEP